VTSPGGSDTPIPSVSRVIGPEFAAIRSACSAIDGADPLDEATSLRIKYAGLGEHDRLLLSGDAGFLLALTDDLTGPVELTLAVRPNARGQGRAAALLGSYLADHGTRTVSAWAHGNHPAAARLAERWGFQRMRELWVLRRGLDPQVGAPALPPGVIVRPYDPTDTAALLATNAAAFAGHPEQGSMDAANLSQRMAEDWFDPAGLLVALDRDGAMLGFHWTKLDPAATAPDGSLVGEVYVIGVAPQAHGRGVGRLLLQAGLHRLATQGVSQVLLYVESDNTAALGLYAALGFTHAEPDTHVRYHRSGQVGP
jgi:mycothiol synthase